MVRGLFFGYLSIHFLIQEWGLQYLHVFEGIMSCWLKLCYKVLPVYHHVLRSWLIPIKDTWPSKLTVLLHFDMQKASSAASSSLSAAGALFVLLGAEEFLMVGQALSPSRDIAGIAPVTKLVAVWTVMELSWQYATPLSLFPSYFSFFFFPLPVFLPFLFYFPFISLNKITP